MTWLWPPGHTNHCQCRVCRTLPWAGMLLPAAGPALTSARSPPFLCGAPRLLSRVGFRVLAGRTLSLRSLAWQGHLSPGADSKQSCGHKGQGCSPGWETGKSLPDFAVAGDREQLGTHPAQCRPQPPAEPAVGRMWAGDRAGAVTGGSRAQTSPRCRGSACGWTHPAPGTAVPPGPPAPAQLPAPPCSRMQQSGTLAPRRAPHRGASQSFPL